VRVTGLNDRAEPIEIEASGWYARIVQHETDHLDGTLYLDRAEPRSLSCNAAAARYWGQPTAEEAARALDWSRDNFTLERVTRTLALCGRDVSDLTAELARRFPDATLTQRIHLRLVDAILAAGRGDTARALDRLATLVPLEVAPSAELWPGYLRGHVYLRLKDGARAGTEFQRVIERRSVSPTSVLYPLAALGAARAAALTGDAATARQQYQRLFDLWSAADPSLAPLADARREYAALR
jgi:hypothetical protein